MNGYWSKIFTYHIETRRENREKAVTGALWFELFKNKRSSAIATS
jgi:hypothetical protein